MECSFPQLKRQPAYLVIPVDYHTRRNDQACRSRRKRPLKELKKWKSLKTSL